MKKDEIDDRLMDALLRGESEEDLGEGLAEASFPEIRRFQWRRSVVVVAAMLVMGFSVASLYNYFATEKSTSEELLAVKEAPSKKERLEQLEIEIAEQEKVVEAKRKAVDTIVQITRNPSFESAGPRESMESSILRFRKIDQGARIRSSRANGERYGELADQQWQDPREEALSTFSVDVDTASYTNIRRLIRQGATIPKDAVRIEELVNYFDYQYPQPAEGVDFAVDLALASCPWEERHHLVRVALQGEEVPARKRGDANLVFLVDVSGSMRDTDKLPLLVESLGLLVEELREDDRISLVVYAGSEGVVLPPTRMGQGGREEVVQALGQLSAGGSTNGGAGIELAYGLARENFVEGGINRVILATDGDFNVGITGRDALVDLVKKEAEDGTFLSVCGFGRGNLNDAMLEAITNEGNGVYYYIDSRQEARRVFLEKLMGTLVTIAKDVKLQVEFNPAKVSRYRLIGYANRILQKEDFNDDAIDAGDIGSGHQVTAFYEIVPDGVEGTVRPEVDELKYQAGQAEAPIPRRDSPDWLTVKLRHKQPDSQVSELQEIVLRGDAKPWEEMGEDYRFAAGVALWGMTMREDPSAKGSSDLLRKMIENSAGSSPPRNELLKLMKMQESR